MKLCETFYILSGYFVSHAKTTTDNKASVCVLVRNRDRFADSRQQSVRVSSGIHERMESGNIAGRVKPILGFRKDKYEKYT